MASADGPAANAALTAAFETLRTASTLAFGGIGFANVVPAEAKAYFEVRAAGRSATPTLHRLLEHATPAGRVYAARLLDDIDAALGRAAWTDLTTGHGSFTQFSGCIVTTRTVADYARERLT